MGAMFTLQAEAVQMKAEMPAEMPEWRRQRHQQLAQNIKRVHLPHAPELMQLDTGMSMRR